MLLSAKFCDIIILTRALAAKFGGLQELRKSYMNGEIAGETLHELEEALYVLAVDFRFYVF